MEDSEYKMRQLRCLENIVQQLSVLNNFFSRSEISPDRIQQITPVIIEEDTDKEQVNQAKKSNIFLFLTLVVTALISNNSFPISSELRIALTVILFCIGFFLLLEVNFKRNFLRLKSKFTSTFMKGKQSVFDKR